MPVSIPAPSTKPILEAIDLRPLGEAQTLVISPRGDMYEVAMAPSELGRILKSCDGTRTIEALAAEHHDPKGFGEVLETLIDAGCLSASPNLEDSGCETPLLGFSLKGAVDINLHVVTTAPFFLPLEQCDLERHFGKVTVEDGSAKEVVETLHPETDLLVVIGQFFDPSKFMAIDAACQERGIRWVSMHLDRGYAWLGPAIVPGRTATYRDLVERRMCCSDSEAMFEAECHLPLLDGIPGPELPSEAELLWMMGQFFHEVLQFAIHGKCRLCSAELQLDRATLNAELFPFLPMPDRQIGDEFLAGYPLEPETLVNHRSGVIIRSVPVKHHESVPESLITVQAHVSNIARKYPCANDVIVGGSSFEDGTAAFNASIGEAIERYCGNYIPGESLRRASYNDLVAAGEYALDPETIVFFSQAMYREPGCPMVPFTRDLEVLWVQGRSLTKNCPAWLPISLVYVNWHTAHRGEPLTNYYWFPGISAGVNLEHALVSGLEEIVERDITMIWWMNRQALPSMASLPELDRLWTPASLAGGQRPWLIYLENEFEIPVMAGVLENTKEGYFNIGFGCRPDPVEAARKAWTEALTLQEGSRDLDDPQGLLRTSVEKWDLIDVPYKDWRKDRKYLDDYRSDFRDISDLLQQQQANLDPRCLEHARSWVDTPGTRTFESVPSLPDRSLATIQKRIESRGFEIFYKDITTPDVDQVGLKSARVLVPGLAPNTSAAFPPLGLGRVQNTPVDLGWRKKPLTEAELNYWPLPHA